MAWHNCIFGGGIKIANNLAVTEEGFVLDARQGKVLDEKIAETKDDLLKMIQTSGVLTGNADWNNYINPGVYNVQNTIMITENHAPVGIYPFGILRVCVSQISDEHRVLQVYYPHQPGQNNNIILVARMLNFNEWKPWLGVQGQLLG